MRKTINYQDRPLKIFAQYILPHRGMFAVDMILSVIIAAVDLTFPYITRVSVQQLLPKSLYAVFFAVMAALAAAYLLKGVLNYLVTVIGHRMGTKVEADMRRDAFTHLQSLPFSYFDRNRTGVLLGRVTNDLFEVVELAHHGPENILTCSLTIVGSVIILMFIKWKLALLLVVMTPACLFFCMRQRRNMQDANIEVKRETGEINAAIEGGISGIRTARAFANEAAETEKFDRANARFLCAKTDWYKYMGLFNAGVESTVGLLQVAVVAYGGYLILRGEMTLVDLLTFTLYVSSFTSPVRKLAQFMEIWSQGTAGFARFLDLMRTGSETEDADEAKAVEPQDVQGDIRFDHVSFAYDNTDEEAPAVLHDINLHIEPGRTLALVGPSGGGKTTISGLVPRFYELSQGMITLDGTDIRALRRRDLRRAVGIIQQDVFLFADTIRENIRFGRPEATDEEVEQAARLAQLHEEILRLPNGYDTWVGERGVLLSGGQKQRVAIARVFLKDPPVLILDEATSALDSVTEQKIQHSLDELAQGRTCLIIAHRLSTVRGADTIAVVEDGRIVEQGSRKDLLERGGAYAALEHAQGL